MHFVDPCRDCGVTLTSVAAAPRIAPRAWRGLVLVALLAPAACGDQHEGDTGHPPDASAEGAAPQYLSRDVLLDPQTCLTCHQSHFNDWAQSVHAYASDDPVFLAMNARGQRETGQALGTFCVQCHAPMAVREGLTTDGLNLQTLAPKYKGVTCFFCHSIEAVDGSHNAMLSLSSDSVMRGEITNPVANNAHASVYSSFQDGEKADSANACGACHDIVVTDTDAAIERTYFEWSHSVFSTSTGSTCIQCHMFPSGDPVPIAQVQNAPLRTFHEHDFPAVDSPLVPASDAGGDAGTERSAVRQTLNGGVLQGALCVTGAGGVRVILDPVGVGHDWPSGAAQDRRAWAEIVAYQAGAVIYQSGVVADGEPITGVTGDPDLWLLRDCMFDAQGNQVNMFWQAASSEGNELPALATFDPLNPDFYKTHVLQRFPRTGLPLGQFPDRVTLRLRLQPIGVDVLNDLVSTQDLDANFVTEMPTFDISLTGPAGSGVLEWTAAAATLIYENSDDGTPGTCVASTGFNVNATRTPAVNPTHCSP